MSSADLEALMNGPSGTPPNGVTPNFDNPPNMTTASYVVTTLSLAITTVLVMTRVYAKVFCLKDVHLPDILGIIAYGIYVGLIWALYDCFVHAGFLVDIWNYRVKDIPNYLYPNYIITILYPVVLLFLKSAILLEWCRIFVPVATRNTFWWYAHSLVLFNVMFYIAMFFGWTFSCTPVELFWKPWVTGTCVDMLSLDLFNGAFNFVTDLAIFFLPQRVIWNLNLSQQKKIGVSFIFAIGLITCGICAARIPFAYRMYTSNNLTFDLSALDLWNVAEMTCGFVVFCVPSTLVVLTRIRASSFFITIQSWFSSLSTKMATSEQQSDQSQQNWEMKKNYRKIDKNTARERNDDLERTWTLPNGHYQPDSVNNESTILRTVQFTAAEGYDDPMTDDQLNSQHPWSRELEEYHRHV